MISKCCGDGDLRVLNHSLKVPPQTFQIIVHFVLSGAYPNFYSFFCTIVLTVYAIENYYGNYCSTVVVHEASVVIVVIVDIV